MRISGLQLGALRTAPFAGIGVPRVAVRGWPLILVAAEITSVQLLKRVLEYFSDLTGLNINYDKSTIVPCIPRLRQCKLLKRSWAVKLVVSPEHTWGCHCRARS
jgi:hypothetical protein